MTHINTCLPASHYCWHIKQGDKRRKFDIQPLCSGLYGAAVYIYIYSDPINTDWSLTYRYMYILEIHYRGSTKTGVRLRLNNYISVFSQHIFEFSSKGWLNILSLRLYCYIY